MKKYLSEIHTKSPEHKKKFALSVSLGITLIIFGIWSLVKWSDLSKKDVVVENSQPIADEITPISNLTSGIANSLEAIKTTATDLKNSVNQVNLQNQYENIRNEALPADAQNGNIDTTNTNGQ
ncbi:MAG: hypothetical protein WAV25_01820 [Minisyncoccia bacterium]